VSFEDVELFLADDVARALKTLQAKLDFDKSELTLFDEEVKVPLETNSAGQFTVYLLGPPAPPETTFDQSW
ncbi:Putative transposon protein, partial [Durusdinium trenchii]